MHKLADVLGRIGACIVIGVVIGLIFGLPEYPIESFLLPILILLLLEFTC